MKEIKFREKNKRYGEWCYGIPIHCTESGNDYMMDNFISDNLCQDSYLIVPAVPCDEKTKSECTYFHDANGKEIYDGDILSDPKDSSYNNRHLITFSETDRYYHAVLLPFVKGQGCDGPLNQEWIDEFKKEIIGNKFDNPELLNNKKKIN